MQCFWHAPPALLQGCACMPQTGNHVYTKINNTKMVWWHTGTILSSMLGGGKVWETVMSITISRSRTAFFSSQSDLDCRKLVPSFDPWNAELPHFLVITKGTEDSNVTTCSMRPHLYYDCKGKVPLTSRGELPSLPWETFPWSNTDFMVGTFFQHLT